MLQRGGSRYNAWYPTPVAEGARDLRTALASQRAALGTRATHCLPFTLFPSSKSPLPIKQLPIAPCPSLT
ncbi:MAG: hypothetical protein KME31_19040 [Tolypothrix carrinoi HA7290-LM1]|nr:hypothetical protein [Tolypothrix carrinoi HA7290-LM1]